MVEGSGAMEGSSSVERSSTMEVSGAAAATAVAALGAVSLGEGGCWITLVRTCEKGKAPCLPRRQTKHAR
jgi:hypothetical protein